MATLMAERLAADRVTCTGIVKWFSSELGYGLIGPDEGDDDLRVEAESVNGSNILSEGMRVEFDVEAGHTGLEAVGVTPLSP